MRRAKRRSSPPTRARSRARCASRGRWSRSTSRTLPSCRRRSGGSRATVVLTHAASRRPRMEGDLIYAETGVASPKVARFAALHEREGAEFLAGVPGCVGGALAMNAGCYGGETWDIVERVATIDRSGTLAERVRSEFDIGYRHCAPKGEREEWFAAAWFRLEPGDGETSRAVMQELLARRT